MRPTNSVLKGSKGKSCHWSMNCTCLLGGEVCAQETDTLEAMCSMAAYLSLVILGWVPVLEAVIDLLLCLDRATSVRSPRHSMA